MLTCTKTISFDSAHRVIGHENKCKNLHGHRFVLEATFTADEVDNIGRIIDFGKIKQILGDWVNSNWDHNVILCKQDIKLGDDISKYTNQKIFYLDENPTSENLCRYIKEVLCPQLFQHLGVECTKIRLYETPNCFAEIQ
jgi:6-pyruvoyltetrahydropterin/6-carboxytetrahydropterin synthase